MADESDWSGYTLRPRGLHGATPNDRVKVLQWEQRPRWEYLRERWDLWPSLAQADTRMGTLGGDGWELVTIWHAVGGCGVQWAIFKRPALGARDSEVSE